MDMIYPDRTGNPEDEHSPDCDCIYCQLDRMQEKADRRREEEIDDYEPPEPDFNADGPAEREHRMDEARRMK